MKTLILTAVGAAAVSASLLSTTLPAAALGDCGPNRHRNPYGYCVRGGQNQSWCLRHKGHVAGGGPFGTRWCGR